MGQPPNKKLPDPKAITDPGDYPYIFGYRDTNGAGVISGIDPNKPNESYRSEINHDGSFETREISDEYDGMVTSHNHHERLNAGSTSKNNDGNVDFSGQATLNSNYQGDVGYASGGTEYKAAVKTISGSAESSTTVAPGGKSYKLYDDDVIEYMSKDRAISVDGNEVRAIGKSSITMVQGDFGIHAQGSNGLDLQSESEAQLRATQKINIQSDTEILLKVGGATVDVTPATITAKIGAATVSITSGTVSVRLGGSSLVVTSGSITGSASLIKMNSLTLPR